MDATSDVVLAPVVDTTLPPVIVDNAPPGEPWWIYAESYPVVETITAMEDNH